MEDLPELLFFDTFSHGSTQELNLDLVQFTNPVYVTEIRVIPLGARVQADFPGGVRLGATNPSEFSVEFFVNDLSTPGAATFQNLGVLKYNQNGPIHYVCENQQIPTDGLILRGWYTTVTLAVYGFITKTRPPPSNLVPQPNPPPKAETPPLRVISEHKTAEWVQQHAQVYHKEAVPYDIKDLNFTEDLNDWPHEKTDDNQKQWERDENLKNTTPVKEDRKQSRKNKRSPEELRIKQTCRRSSGEKDFCDQENEVTEHLEHGEKKLKVEYAHRSPSRSSSSHGEPKKKSEICSQDELEPLEPAVVPVVQCEKPLEMCELPKSPKLVKEKPDEAIPIPPPAVLAPEDVEMISEEEISEVDEVESFAVSNMQVIDEVLHNETRTPSVHEDSLDMDQFEPILSGSSDIESEEDIDFQDVEFDPNDLLDEPSKMFNPFEFEVQTLVSIKKPHMTDYEWDLLQLKILENTISSTDEIKKLRALLSSIEQKSFADGPDDWVTNVENIIPVLKAGLIGCDDRIDVISRLGQMVKIGLDFEKAYNQPKPAFKVRHLKAGINLAETLCRCSEAATLELIKCSNLHHQLLNLYEKEHLAFSIRLAILKALDASLSFCNSVKYFVNADEGLSGYCRLVRVFSSTSTIRVRYALANLLRKVHLYEMLENLYAMLAQSNTVTDDADTVAMYLEEVVRYLREASSLISQPVRFLPISSRFEFAHCSAEPYFTVYSYLDHFQFLELLLTTMTTPQFITHPGVVCCVLEILAEFADTENGLIFLSSQSSTTNRILKILSNVDEQYSISPQLGLHLAHRLYVLNLMDNFQYKWQIEQMADIDNTQLLDIFSAMYSLSFTILGRQSITHVLSRGDIIKPFLKTLQFSHNTGRERRKSPGRGYIVDLVWMVVKSSDYVPFLERHGSDLIEIASWQADASNSSWLNPIRNGEQCFSYNDVTELCDYLKKHTEKVTTYPGELITALRILRYLGVPPLARRVEEEDEPIELRYKFVLIQLFSQEGLTFLTSILHKVCNHYERPHLHAHTLAGKEGVAMMSLLTPVLQLMRALLEYVIRCRDVEFKDLTAVPALLKTYCLLYYIPPISAIHMDAVEGGKEIVETLLAYTQTVAIDPLTDTRSLNKSLWTSMMSEVLKFSVSVPEMFAPCLSLLSELLPLPLPVQTRTPLSDIEVSLIMNSRKLWSAHLLPLEGALQEMISTLCWSSYQPLLQLLKRVCVQLADLGPPTALAVARSILNSLWTELVVTEYPLSSRCARLLGILACLLTHPPLKMTVIQVTSGAGKADEPFNEFWPTLLKHLSQSADGNVYHTQAQEFIISCIQSLCDIEISLHPPPSQSVPLESYLSNSLPPKNLFRSLCDTLVTHMENATKNTLSTLAAAVRTCTTLSEYDYGMYRLKVCLSEHPNALWAILRKMANEWSRENAECVNCLTNFLEFCKNSLSSDVPAIADSSITLRTLSISPNELGGYMKWNVELSENEKHPLVVVENQLLDSVVDEELFQSLRSNVSALIETLNAAQAVDDAGEAAIEMMLDPPEPLLLHFQSRVVYLVGDIEDERLSVAYWLSTAPLDELDQEAEQVACNLAEIVNTYIPNLQLEAELEKLGHHETAHLDQTSKKSDTTDQPEEFENKPVTTVLVKPAKPRTFIRPMLGPHRNDAFRSRIPNSSRAPSLHVDDFIALEKHNQQQATVGYNRLGVKHQAADLLAVSRNRAHSFLQDRNSHFHSTFRPSRGMLNTWHPLLMAEQASRTVVKSQPSVIRHPPATPLMIRGPDLMRFSLSLRWPSPPPPLRAGPVSQMRHHPPPHASLHRHLRPPPPSFSSL